MRAEDRPSDFGQAVAEGATFSLTGGGVGPGARGSGCSGAVCNSCSHPGLGIPGKAGVVLLTGSGVWAVRRGGRALARQHQSSQSGA